MSSLPITTANSPCAGRDSSVGLLCERRARFEAFGISHRGAVRPINEDSYAVAADVGLCLVADGMGGHAAGEVASRMATDAVRATFQDPEITWPGAMEGGSSPVPGLPLLVAAVQRANARVLAAARANSSRAGMGTTVTALLVLADRVGIAHVGDSRLYRQRGRRLQRLTHDHTLVNEYLLAGRMTQEDAEASPYRHVLSRAIGTDPEVHVDRRLVVIEPGDTFLLATDGLHGVVGDDDINAVLQSEPDLTRAATQLIEAALDRGGPDNVTVVLCRILALGTTA